MDFILASKSPRRREILKDIGLPFSVVETNAEEEDTEIYSSPLDTVKRLSYKKAAAALPFSGEESLIIGADTIVVIDGNILGKPKDYEEGRLMLKSLSGKTHTVYTGMTLIYNSKAGVKEHSSAALADVRIKPLSDSEIKAYLDTGEYADKAGAYGIQEKGAALVEAVNGDYFAVVGFSVSDLFDSMKKIGLNLYDFWR